MDSQDNFLHENMEYERLTLDTFNIEEKRATKCATKCNQGFHIWGHLQHRKKACNKVCNKCWGHLQHRKKAKSDKK